MTALTDIGDDKGCKLVAQDARAAAREGGTRSKEEEDLYREEEEERYRSNEASLLARHVRFLPPLPFPVGA